MVGEGTIARDGGQLLADRVRRKLPPAHGCLSFSECALVNPDDRLAERGPGAHLLNPG